MGPTLALVGTVAAGLPSLGQRSANAGILSQQVPSGEL